MRGFLLAMLVVFSGLASTPATGQADEGNFLVFPITTDLQKTAFGYRPGAKAYVLVNGKGLVPDGDAVRWKALDFDALRKALGPFKEGKDAVVIFHVFHDGSNQSDGPRLLGWTLVGFGRSAGYRDAYETSNFDSSFDWEKHLAVINASAAGKPDADEPSTGNDVVKVNPVRTILSRHLFGNADCVVTITATFDERWDGTLQPEVAKAIRLHVSNLKLTDKGTLRFRIRYKASAKDASERFHLTTAKEIADALGFERHVTNSWQEP